MANTTRTARIEYLWKQSAQVADFVSDKQRTMNTQAAIHAAAVQFHLSPAIVAEHCDMICGLDY